MQGNRAQVFNKCVFRRAGMNWPETEALREFATWGDPANGMLSYFHFNRLLGESVQWLGGVLFPASASFIRASFFQIRLFKGQSSETTKVPVQGRKLIAEF